MGCLKINLNQLRGFTLVAQTGSITQAAKYAYISQPAMTKLIKQLETELGVCLFDRIGRQVRLNAKGRLFNSYVESTLNQLQAGIDAVTTINNVNQKPIRLLVEVASSLIPDFIHKIQQLYPEKPVQLIQRISIANDAQQYDFMISNRKLESPGISVPLVNEEIFVGCAGNQITSDYVSFEQLKELPIIGLGGHTPLRTDLDAYFERNNVSLNYQYESDDPATIRELLLSNEGVGFIPAVSWKRVGEKLHLARLISSPPFRTIYLSQPKKNEDVVTRVIANALVELFVFERQTALTI